MTGIPQSTSLAATGTTQPPPSSLTAFMPALTNAVALATACSTERWYEPKGMSPTRSRSGTTRATALAWCSISSSVTGSVVA